MSYFFKFFLDKSILSIKYRFYIFIIFILLLISTILEMLSIGMIIPLITSLFDSGNFQKFEKIVPDIILNNKESKNFIIYYMLTLIIFIYAFKNSFLFLQHYFQISFIKKISLKLQFNMLKSYSIKDSLFFKDTNSSEILRNYTEEVKIFTNILVQRFLIIVTEIVIIFSIIIFIYFINPIISIFIFLYFSILSFGFYFFIQKKLFNFGKQRQQFSKETIKYLNEFINLFLEIKLLNKLNFFLDKTSKAYTKVVESQTKRLFYSPILKLLIEFFFILLFCLLVYLLVSQNKNLNEIISLLGFLAAASFKLLPSINKLNAAIQEFRYYLPTAKKVIENVNVNTNIELEKTEKNLLKDFESMRINNLKFSYKDKEIFNNAKINFHFNRIYGIVGKSGSGKTTFLNILMGFYPSNQSILYNEIHQLSDFRPIQNQISYVPQNVYLFDESIIKNITLKNDLIETDVEKVKKIFENMGLSDFVDNLKYGLNTIVGERGTKLSGGQIQRIGLARALFHNRRILILDEFTSSLDNKTENELLKFLQSISKNITIIMVTHRQKPLEICNEIFEIKHKQLLKI